jgi:methyl-accepting chemotaxis protein
MSFIRRLGDWGPFRVIGGSIRYKLIVALLLISLVPLATVGVAALWNAEQALRERATGQLASIATQQKERLDQLFKFYSATVASTARNPDLDERLQKFLTGDGDKAALTAEIEDRLKVAMTGVPAALNMHIVDVKGKVVADTLPGKENQKGQDKTKDTYFTGAMANPGKIYVKSMYRSSTGYINAAVSQAVYDRLGKVVGVLVMRVKLDEVSRILLDRTGMGETGESYLVTDGLYLSGNLGKIERTGIIPKMASQSRFVTDSMLKQKVDTAAARKALAERSGTEVYVSYRGHEVLGAYTWFPELRVGLISELESAEAFSAVANLRWVILGVGGVALLVVLIVAFWLSGGLTRQVDSIVTAFSQIGMGDFKARAKVVSHDELGAMAENLNAMLDNTLGLIQTRDERDQIQESIMKLLEEIGGVADGDLTKEAEVTADVTGAIADSFNHMIEQLRNIISNVQNATLQVSTSANQIHTTAEQLALGSESQASQILNTSAAVDEMAVSIQQVSENAGQSAKVAEQALANARQGAEAVQNTIQGMGRIRDQVQETSKRIKRLGESSQQIGEIVQLIDDIADRTSILALNASIQAAMAGEAGRGFAVVAEEVERLAERSTNATKKIANLVKTIQSETNEAVTAMEEGTREVVEGSKLANQAGQALTEIDKVSGRLAELIQSISLAANQQARASEGVAKAMTEISDVTQQTATGTKQAAASVSNLAVLADELRGSVSTFRLPGGRPDSTIDPLASPRGVTNGHGKGNGNGHGNGHGDGKGSGKRRSGLLPRR